MPTVSIIMNCYNGEKYLRDAIDSIYSQTYEDWELIFFDNASTDGSAAIAKSYDSRLIYVKNDLLVNLGAARKLAVEHARGEWVAFLDTDDRWYKNKLERQLKELKYSDYVFCYGGIREIDADGNQIKKSIPLHTSGDLLKQLLFHFEVNMVTPVFKRELIKEFGLNFDGNMTASEEYNLFMRIAAVGKGLVLKEILGDYRVYSESLSFQKIKNWAVERRYTLEQLKILRPSVEAEFPDAWNSALTRARYYDACSLMASGELCQAREVMWEISKKNYVYKILFAATLIPVLWNYLHSRSVKIKLSKLAARLQ